MPLDLRWSCLTKLRSFEVTYLQSNVTWLKIFGFISISFVQFYSFPCFILLSSKSWRDDFCNAMRCLTSLLLKLAILILACVCGSTGMVTWRCDALSIVSWLQRCFSGAQEFSRGLTSDTFSFHTADITLPAQTPKGGKVEDVEVVEQETSGNVRQGVVWDFFFLQRKETFTPHGFQSHYSRPRLHRFWLWIRRLWKFLEDLRCKRCRVEVASRNKCIDEYNSFRCFHILRFYLSHFFSNPQHTYFTINIHLPIFLYLKISFIFIYLLIIHDVLHEYMLHLHLYY